jgi:hypothetical protein
MSRECVAMPEDQQYELSQILEMANRTAVHAQSLKDPLLTVLSRAIAYVAADQLGVPAIAVELMQRDIAESRDAAPDGKSAEPAANG